MNAQRFTDVLTRKYRTFRRDPLGSTGHRLRMLCDWCYVPLRYCDEQWDAHRLRRRGYVDFLASRPPHAIPPNYSDLWFLYETVRRRRPRCILEFGSGCSTVILTQALWEIQRESPSAHRRLFAVETDPYWAEVTVASLPPHLRALCDIQCSRLLEVEYEGTPALRHADVPDVVPDFVYLDGPPLTPERQVASDVLELEDRFPKEFCMVVDGRWKNLRFFRQHCRRRYRFKEVGLSLNHHLNQHVVELWE